MQKTPYNRNLDNVGRLVIPSKLRAQLSLEPGDNCEFFIHENDEKTFLCIECPKALNEIEKAKRLLVENGYKID